MTPAKGANANLMMPVQITAEFERETTNHNWVKESVTGGTFDVGFRTFVEVGGTSGAPLPAGAWMGVSGGVTALAARRLTIDRQRLTTSP